MLGFSDTRITNTVLIYAIQNTIKSELQCTKIHTNDIANVNKAIFANFANIVRDGDDIITILHNVPNITGTGRLNWGSWQMSAKAFGSSNFLSWVLSV